MEENSLGGKRYFVIFKDDYSKYTYVYFLKQKSEVEQKLKCFLAQFKDMHTSTKPVWFETSS